jgi:hypothetical protein
MSYLSVDAKKYTGKVVSHFEDYLGNSLSDLHMLEELVIVFTDGEKIYLSQDWRGSSCYFSQYEI